MSSLLNNYESLSKNSELYQNKYLYIIYDKWNIPCNKLLSPILSHLLGNVVTIQPLKFALLRKFTLSGFVHEYIKAISMIQIFILFQTENNCKEWFYYKNSREDEEMMGDLGFGILLDINHPENINYYDHFRYFVINNDSFEPVEVNNYFKKSLFKKNTQTSKEKYGCKILVLSENISITDELLKNISKEINVDTNTLSREFKDKEEWDKQFKIMNRILDTTAIENSIVIPAIPLFLFLDVDNQIEIIKNIFSVAFDKLEELLNHDFHSYIIKETGEDVYTIESDEFIITLLIKHLIKSNSNEEIYKGNKIYIRPESSLDLSDLLDTGPLSEIVRLEKKSIFTFIEETVTSINKQLSELKPNGV